MAETFTLHPTRDNYCVFGNPVAHSLSPVIHTLFAEQTGQPVHYQAIQVPSDQFAETLLRFRDRGGKGLSVTIPFKLDACDAADELTERALQAGAVNTIWFDEQSRVHGDNTDGIGLVTDILQNLAVTITDKRILIIGAGGAVQGILGPLINERPAQIVITNRTIARAEKLRQRFSASGLVNTLPFEQLDQGGFDIVINGTSTSLSNELPPVPATVFSGSVLSYDLMYAKTGTVFQSWSQQHGTEKAVDGLGMLVEQAAAAFEIWRGVRPETTAVIRAIKKTV